MARHIQAGVLQQTGSLTTFEPAIGSWHMIPVQTPSSLALLANTLALGADGELHRVEQSSSGNNTDRMIPLSQRNALVIGGENEQSTVYVYTFPQMTSGTTTHVTQLSTYYRDRFPATSTGNQLLKEDNTANTTTNVTIPSADSGLYLMYMRWGLTNVPNAPVEYQIYDNTSATVLARVSRSDMDTGGSLMAIVRKTAGAAMDVRLRTITTASGSRVMLGLGMLMVKLGPLDPNPVTAVHASPVTRPAAP